MPTVTLYPSISNPMVDAGSGLVWINPDEVLDADSGSAYVDLNPTTSYIVEIGAMGFDVSGIPPEAIITALTYYYQVWSDPSNVFARPQFQVYQGSTRIQYTTMTSLYGTEVAPYIMDLTSNTLPMTVADIANLELRYYVRTSNKRIGVQALWLELTYSLPYLSSNGDLSSLSGKKGGISQVISSNGDLITSAGISTLISIDYNGVYISNNGDFTSRATFKRAYLNLNSSLGDEIFITSYGETNPIILFYWD